jgi:hypothetical protein
VGIREFFLQNFAGDLEYHPRRAAIYLLLAVRAAGFWILTLPESKFTTVPLAFALGSLTLLGKGIFLLRRSSEGLGLSHAELAEPATTPKRKSLPPFPEQAAQIVQDFGTGGLLLWPLLGWGKDVDSAWSSPPELRVFLVGAFLFGLGWVIRRYTKNEKPQG